jgi:hypothetical protein
MEDSSRVWSGELCARPSHLCAHPCVCATILRVCAGVQAICARVRATCARVRAFCAAVRRLVRAEAHLCAPQTTCAELWHGFLSAVGASLGEPLLPPFFNKSAAEVRSDSEWRDLSIPLRRGPRLELISDTKRPADALEGGSVYVGVVVDPGTADCREPVLLKLVDELRPTRCFESWRSKLTKSLYCQA